MVTPIDFINTLRESDTYIQMIYTNGGCYQFYKVLKLLYPEAEAYKIKGPHVVTKIDGKYYDITGELNTASLTDIEKVCECDREELEHWSFAYNNWLYRECQNCGEPIIA